MSPFSPSLVFFRRTSNLASRALVARSLSTVSKKSDSLSFRMPHKAYDHGGHLKTDQLEFLDQQVQEAVLLVEDNLNALKNTHSIKREHLEKNNHDAIPPLMELAAQQKQDMTENLARLKALLQDVHFSKSVTYAVDAPDGESDGRFEEEMQEVHHIIAEPGNKKRDVSNMKEFAVDSPDGEADRDKQDQMMDASHQIDEMSVTENKAQVEAKHQMETRIKHDRARDPEHDW